jgi:hypothetical protein
MIPSGSKNGYIREECSGQTRSYGTRFDSMSGFKFQAGKGSKKQEYEKIN